jgi:hypothetical protein
MLESLESQGVAYSRMKFGRVLKNDGKRIYSLSVVDSHPQAQSLESTYR